MIKNSVNAKYTLAYRSDIDGLRSFAVISVILFHAFPKLLPSGFIGVDIFFVISGFLISSILLNDLERSSFSIAKFYSRRILRIFPALLLVLIFCLVLGWFLLLSDEYQQLGKHTVSGVAFLSNLTLWLESGYFDGASDHKLLLHLWSLAIEEQFYLVWPIFLWAAWRYSKVLLFLVLACALSFIANIFNVYSDLTGTFYLPWYRFWELGIGGLLAYTKYTPKTKTIANASSIAGLSLLVCGLFLIGKNSLFPGWWALLPTLGTALLITAGNAAFFNQHILSNKLLVGIGLISFPMYLWHWPLITFSRIYWGDPNIVKLSIAAVLSVPLAWATYHFIEKPIRFNNLQKWATVAWLIGLSLVIAIAGLAIYYLDGIPERNLANKHQRIAGDLKWNYWDDKKCNKLFDISPCQMTPGGSKKILILGDSHANQLFPGIARNEKSLGVINIGSCAPLDDIQVLVSKNQDHHPGLKDACMQKNYQLLAQNPQIDTVIVSTFMQPLLDGRSANQKDFEYWGKVTLKSRLPEEQKLTQYQLLENGLIRALKKIEALQKKIIFVIDPPSISEDFRDYCIKRNNLGAQSLSCTIPRVQYEAERTKEIGLIEKIRTELPDVVVFDPIDLFCDEANCFLIRDGKSLYRDHDHLSEYGSAVIGEAIGRRYFFLK